MADNVVSNLGAGGATWATKDSGGVHHAKHLIEIDVSGTPTLVSVTVPVPTRHSDGSAYQDFAVGDMDTGAPTLNKIMVGLALPGSGGAVVGGTATNPVRIDPTGTTTQPVEGELAHDDPIVVANNKPLLAAGRANDDEPADVANGDAVLAWMCKKGRLVTTEAHPPKVADGSTHGPIVLSLAASTTETVLVAAPGAGQSIHVTEIVLVNAHATQKTTLSIKDNTTIRAFLGGKVAGDTSRITFRPAWKLTANQALKVQQSDAADATVTAHFFTAP